MFMPMYLVNVVVCVYDTVGILIEKWDESVLGRPDDETWILVSNFIIVIGSLYNIAILWMWSK